MLWSSTVRRLPVFLIESMRVSSNCLIELTAMISISGFSPRAFKASWTQAPVAAMVIFSPSRMRSHLPY